MCSEVQQPLKKEQIRKITNNVICQHGSIPILNFIFIFDGTVFEALVGILDHFSR